MLPATVFPPDCLFICHDSPTQTSDTILRVKLGNSRSDSTHIDVVCVGPSIWGSSNTAAEFRIVPDPASGRRRTVLAVDHSSHQPSRNCKSNGIKPSRNPTQKISASDFCPLTVLSNDTMFSVLLLCNHRFAANRSCIHAVECITISACALIY